MEIFLKEGFMIFAQRYKYMCTCLFAVVWQRNQVVLNMEVSSYG